MLDFNIEIFQNNRLTEINFSEYLKNKTVVVCSAAKFIQRPTLEYFKYMDSLLDSHNLDEIILVNSKEDNFFHMLVKSYFPRLTTVTDKHKKYISTLKNIKQVNQNLEELTKNWSFQHLLKNGSEIGFWQQPLSNMWDELLKNKKAIKSILKLGSHQGKIFKKMYNERHKVDFWNLKHTNFLYLNIQGSALLHQIGPKFFYFHLFHNKNLEDSVGLINK